MNKKRLAELVQKTRDQTDDMLAAQALNAEPWEPPPGMGDAPRVQHVRNCPGYSQRRPIIPAGGVYIGRRLARYRLPESKWHNPFMEPRAGSRAEVIAKHRAWLCDQPVLIAALPDELRGRDLYCWCAPLPCHGDVLLALANRR